MFIKYLRDYHDGYNECTIAKIIMEKQREQPNGMTNIVSLYNVCSASLSMEELDIMSRKQICKEKLFDDVSKGLQQLNSCGIVYIDLKIDNIGWSRADQCFKLFDFDCSGLCTVDGKRWILEPAECYAYKKLKSNIIDIDNCLFDFDKMAFKDFKSACI